MIYLNGHSGCLVSLLDSNIVRKISPNELYNNRLFLQMNKQMTFKHHLLFSPKVIDSGYDKHGLFFFDMEYIKGDSLSSIFRKESISNCEYLLDQIQTIHKCNSKKIDIFPDILKKLQAIEASENDIVILKNCDWNVATGFCHGDLTFENIIVCKNRIYLIDFLDSFVDAPLIDESKLLQDAFCYWSFREGYIPKRKLIRVCSKFHSKQHYCMLLLHLMRILPYSSNPIKETVICMMNKVRNKINQF